MAPVKKLFRTVLSRFASKLVILFSMVSTMFFFSNVIYAHTPHDDIFSVAISPEYKNDRTVLIITRGMALRSTDGGKDWHRIVNGLDNHFVPFSIDISDTNKKVMFMATLGDGLYKSEDEGASWFPIGSELESGVLDLVAVSPNNSDTVFVRDAAGRMFRSLDGGISWTGITPDDVKISAFTFVSETRSEIVIGDISGTVYLSNNAGDTWNKLQSTDRDTAITAIAARRLNDSGTHIFVGTAIGEVLKLTDGGAVFERLFQGNTDQTVTDIAFSPDYPQDGSVFAVLWDDGILYSGDRGKTWVIRTDGLTRHNQSKKQGRPAFGSILVSSNYVRDRTLFLAGYDGLFRSTDSGKKWSQIETLSPVILTGLGISPNFAEDKTVAVTSYLWGAYLSNDNGASWHPVNSGVGDYNRTEGLTRLFNIVFSPGFGSDRVLFSSTWYRILKSDNSGRRWKQTVPVDSKSWRRTHHAMILVPSPTFDKDSVVYIGTHRGQLFKSRDRGESFSLLHEFETGISSLVLSPNFSSDSEIFAGVNGDIYKSVDGGYIWSRKAFDLCSRSPAGTIIRQFSAKLPGRLGNEMKKWGGQIEKENRLIGGVKLVISPNYASDHMIFAGTSVGLFSSSDGGEIWTPIGDSVFGPHAFIEGIGISPDYGKDRTLLISVRGKGLFKSTDGGWSFSSIGRHLIEKNHLLSNPPYFPIPNSAPIMFSPTYAMDQIIFGYSYTSLFRSSNGGQTWEQVFTVSPSIKDRVFAAYIRPGVEKAKHLFRRKTVLILAIYIAIVGGVILFIVERRSTKKKIIKGHGNSA